MLKTLRLRNFKSHHDTTLETGQLNVFIGPHGSGKSAVAHAIQLLCNSSGKEGLSFTGGFAGLDYTDVVHRRNDRSKITIGLDLQLLGAPVFLSQTGEYSVRYHVTFDNSGISEQAAVYEFPTLKWEFRTPRIGRWSVPDGFALSSGATVEFAGGSLVLLPFRYRLDRRDYPSHRALNDLRLAVCDFVARLHVVPDNRVPVSYRYSMSPLPQRSVQTLEQALSLAAGNWDVRDEVSKYLHQILGRRINFRAVGEMVLLEVADGLGAPYPITCEGSGLRALVWPLIAIAACAPGDLVFIEEPEIHLHPKAVGGLADLLVQSVAKKSLQLALTTHNEHLLLSLLAAVRRGDLRHEDICIYYFQDRDGQTVVSKLEVDSSGEIDGGLPGFFEASLHQLQSFVSALKGSNG